MPANTPTGLPYPLATEPVAEGAAAIQALATALDSRAGAVGEWYQSTTASVPSGAVTVVTQINTALAQNRGSFSLAAGVVTVNSAGWYLVAGAVTYAVQATGQRLLILALNGTEVYRLTQIATFAGGSPMGGGIPVYLAAGAKIDLRLFQDSGSALNFSNAGIKLAQL